MGSPACLRERKCRCGSLGLYSQRWLTLNPLPLPTPLGLQDGLVNSVPSCASGGLLCREHLSGCRIPASRLLNTPPSRSPHRLPGCLACREELRNHLAFESSRTLPGVPGGATPPLPSPHSALPRERVGLPSLFQEADEVFPEAKSQACNPQIWAFHAKSS